MKQILTLEQAMEVLQPHYEDIVSVMNGGFDDFQKIQNFISDDIGYVNLQVRTKTNLIHDLTAQRLIDKFSDEQNIEVGIFNKIFGLNIDDKLFIRFKKMNNYFAVSNLKTKQHKNFMRQYPIEGLPEEPTYLFAGYIPELTWKGIRGIYFACWHGNTLQWIDDAGTHRSIEQTTLKIDFTKESSHTAVEKYIRINASKVLKLDGSEKE